MSDTKNTGGPAFPHETYHGVAAPGSGMTLRDWFAGQALAGIAASNGGDSLSLKEGQSVDDAIAEYWSVVGRTAYIIADAMIAARAAE